MGAKSDDLQRRVRQLEEENKLLQSKLNTYFTGDVTQNATLYHLLLSKYCRIRLAEKAKTPALLAK
jgi:hypothetical protein